MRFWENIVNNLRKRYQGTQGNETKIADKMSKGKTFQISNPTSYRTFHKGDDGSYLNAKVDIGITNPNSVQDVQGISSTAVSKVKYNPKAEIATVRFNGGKKDYDYRVNPKEMTEFINAPSKGRHINRVWKYNNHI